MQKIFQQSRFSPVVAVLIWVLEVILIFWGKNIQKEILKLLGQMILTRPLAQLLENILNMK